MFGTQDAATLVDAAAAREHIARLRAASLGYARIAHLAGTSTRHLRDIARAAPAPTQRAPIRRIRAGLADALLAIEPTKVSYRPDAQGTRRRLTALVALGWPLAHIAALLGRRTDSLTRTLAARSVSAATAAAAARLYDELSSKPPPCTSVTASARRYARCRGWVPPLAWDDIDADSGPADAAIEPAAVFDEHDVDEIAIQAATAGRLTWRQLTDAEVTEAVRRLIDRGRSIRSVAAQLRASRAIVRRHIADGAAR